MKTTTLSTNGRTLIRLSGRFDFESHKEFRAAVDKALGEAPREIQIDLGEVEYVDSSALGMLLMTRDKATAVGKEVALANCRGNIKQVLEIANFNKLFSIV